MQKSKLGFSVGLFGAIFCILGAVIGISWPLLAIAAYVFVREENEWLRRLTLKVVIILLAGAVITMIIPYILGAFYDVINLFVDDADIIDFNWITKISTFTVKYIDIIINVVLVLIGLKALKQSHFSVKSVDNIISKNV